MKNFYKPDNIKSHIAISQYLKDQGVEVSNGRAVATWRDGKRMSVSVSDEKGLWHDFVDDAGGSVIDLFIRIEGERPVLEVCETLGDRYHLTPDKTAQPPKKMTRGEMLIADGYRLVKSYAYVNTDGTPRYWVDRYEHSEPDKDGKKRKEFVQRGPLAENLNGIEKTIYNLPDVISSERVFVTEGEKDADTLMSLGLTATTNSGGAKYWENRFNQYFTGKDVVLMLDNDHKGQERGRIVGGQLEPVAKSVKSLTISKLPKGDITDWLDKEGGTLDALLDAVKNAGKPNLLSPDICAAKIANEEPLKNYTSEWVETKRGTREVKHPRTVDEICADMSTRFLGFPKCIGSALFDYVRSDEFKNRKIVNLLTSDDLKAWVDGTSHHQSDFASGSSFCNYKELHARLLQTRPTYDVIARAPWFPVRDDAFAAYEALPSADGTGRVIEELMSFFLPATPADATLMLAFFMAPMYHTAAARPAWIIDTVDAQASGKTTVVKACGWIYGEDVLDIDIKTLEGDLTSVKKRVLSSEGRMKRIALFDNITTSLKSGNLSNLITAQSISGMRPYGHGEETRKNDITWCATVNGATVDTDMATRSYVIHIKSPADDADPMWEKRLRDFIELNRTVIQATFMEMMRNAPMRRRKKSRFGEFDAVVLSAACRTEEEFYLADIKIRTAAEAANDDSDLAAQCVEAITNALTRHDAKDTKIRIDLPCAIKCTDVDEILRRTSGGVRNWTSRTVRKFVNGGHIPQIVKGIERVDTSDGRKHFGKSRCFIFSPVDELLANREQTQFIVFDCGAPSVVGIGRS